MSRQYRHVRNLHAKRLIPGNACWRLWIDFWFSVSLYNGRSMPNGLCGPSVAPSTDREPEVSLTVTELRPNQQRLPETTDERASDADLTADLDAEHFADSWR